MANNHVKNIFTGENIQSDSCLFFNKKNERHSQIEKLTIKLKGHFSNIFIRPISVLPHQNNTIYCAVSVSDNLITLKEKLSELTHKNNIKNKISELENSICKNSDTHIYTLSNKYIKSVELLKSVLLTNIVYPVYTQKSYIKHSTPGKWWDCLYTWDSGFIGLGLLEYSLNRAIENLNVYMTEEGNQSEFIHHGSPVPVQHYLFFEIWNRTQSKKLLKYFYPKLKKYYMFLRGNYKSSTTNIYKSNLLQTWDYFYNSGGWDDYPPQHYMHEKSLKGITPVITNSQCIRIAKFFKMYADILNIGKDKIMFTEDINKFTEALQNYSWDKNAGYFSYVCHDNNGLPIDIFKFENTENFNKGLDGAYPIVAGICDKKHEKILLQKIKSTKCLWSKAGLSAIDQSASYFRKDGYWNVTVWMAHQWFYWKTMLDIGDYKFAEKIALRALDIWKNETDKSDRCLEHFLIETKRGAGWYAFGGLSSPVINWFHSYFVPGTISTGFDTIILNKKGNKDFTKFNLKIYPRTFNQNKTSLIMIANPNFSYQLSSNKKIFN